MVRPLVILDTETATLRAPPHLLEVGAVRVVAGEAVEHFERLVRPDVPIQAEARAIHGIGEDDVRDADEPRSVLADFAEFVGDDWMVAHNARFDAGVLGFEYARRELPAPRGVVLDTLPLARRALPEAPDHKLTTLVEHLLIEGGKPHRALGDAVAAWRVLEAGVARAGGWSATSDAWLLREGGARVTLAGAGPSRPRKPVQVVRALERASREGARAWLWYGERGEAPLRLEVFPRLLYRWSERDYLEGECARSGSLKTYRLDRVRKVELCA
jgi:DNA polymerase III epsilon subunit family exonuclease